MPTKPLHPDQAQIRDSRETLALYAVVAAAVAMAIVSARDLAGGWNDGSRLATVEALVDHHTLAIDDSIFVKIPWPAKRYQRPPDYEQVTWLKDAKPQDPFPYPLEYPGAWIGDLRHSETMGTRDKIMVGGHYYSHKPPVPAVLLVPWYFVLQQFIGLVAHDHCDDFCYWMTLGSSGASYVVALVCTFQLGGVLRLPLAWRLALAASLGFCTVTVAYVRHVNDHILLLAVAGGLALALAHFARRVGSEEQVTGNREQGTAGRKQKEGGKRGKVEEGTRQMTNNPWPARESVSAKMQAESVKGPSNTCPKGLLAVIGCLAGLAYTIDQATGPAMLLATAALVAHRAGQRWKALTIFSLAAFPWLALHHAISYSIGGTLLPIGSIPEFFDWPGSSFDRGNMTGFWNHQSLGDFAIYLFELSILPLHGFLPHNMPLLLTLPGAVVLWRRRTAQMPELLWGVAWCVGAGLLYAALSSNYGGYCCSIRWFVPFLAVGYYFLAALVRDDHRYRTGFVLFSGLGAALAYFEWQQGPWLETDELWFQVLERVGLLLWPLWMIWTWRKGPSGIADRGSRIAD